MDRNQIEITIEITVKQHNNWNGPHSDSRIEFLLPEDSATVPNISNADQDAIRMCLNDYMAQRREVVTEETEA